MPHFQNWFKKGESFLGRGVTLPLLILLAFVAIVYQPFFLKGLLPIPADTIVGLYHPWRDFYKEQYPSGMPYKNYLITDAVRQLYPWRQLAITQMKQGESPLWNPYSFSGMPLAANLQTATYYPLNIVYWLLSFPLGWSIQVILQTVLGGIFMILFLKRLQLRSEAVALGTLAWVGSGFFVAWLASNTLGHAASYLPLLFLGVDLTKEKNRRAWYGVAVITLGISFSFLAGALQIFGYCLVAMGAYSTFIAVGVRSVRPLLLTILGLLGAVLLTFPQWRLLLLYSGQVVRSVSSLGWQTPEWFIPIGQLIQFISPDYFGNPATLNYFGIWNYMEFIGYFGIVPLIMVMMAILLAYKKSVFWLILVVTGLLFATNNPIAKIPYQLAVPFFSWAQPTRLLVVINFGLAVLTAIGCQSLLAKGAARKQLSIVIALLAVLLLALWRVAFMSQLVVSRNNLVLPTILFCLSSVLLFFWSKKTMRVIIIVLLLITLFDLTRFMTKFESFSPDTSVFPNTKITNYLAKVERETPIRVVALDDRVMPPNFSVAYAIPMASGYDSFYLKRYEMLVEAINQNTAYPTLGNSNRVLIPHATTHNLFPLLNVSYVLSYGPKSVDTPAELVEGNTYLYKQPSLPRAFYVSRVENVRADLALSRMFALGFDPKTQAVVEGYQGTSQFAAVTELTPSPSIVSYQPDEVTMEVDAHEDRFLVFLDSYYPSWRATIDGKETKIYPTNEAFRGVVIPKGSKIVRFFLN